MDWLISTAAAQAPAAAGPGGFAGGPLIMMAVLGVMMYLMVIRPQNKRAKEHRQLISAIESGSEVVTNGGIMGKVTDVGDQIVTVEIAEGVRVKVQRHTITQILPTGTLKAS
jgi:preprotein translocase subunit YajC